MKARIPLSAALSAIIGQTSWLTRRHVPQIVPRETPQPFPANVPPEDLLSADQERAMERRNRLIQQSIEEAQAKRARKAARRGAQKQ